MKALVPPLALCAAVLGCDPPPEAPPGTREGAAPAPAARRGRLVAGERVERVIAWPDPGRRDERARERLSAAARAAVDASPVPVLAPGGTAWATLTISSPRAPEGPGFGFTLAARSEGRTLSLHGSRLATLVPGIGRHEGPDRLRGLPGFVSENEGIQTATWIEHGAAYALDLECASPRSPGCDAAALRAEVEALVYVGGRGER